VDGRIAGAFAATVTLIILGFVALGLFTSIAGVLIAGTIAVVAGTGAAAIADPHRSGRSAAVVAAYVGALILGYVLVGQTAARYAQPGSRGGPGVTPRK